MLLHEVRTASLGKKKARRVGRGPGSGCGKTCGRGLEGATSRSGWSMKVTYEGGQMPLFRRLPKRGFTNGPFRKEYAEVNVKALAVFENGACVGRKELLEKGLLRGKKGLPIKILGEGDLKAALTVTADRFTKSAEEKIAQAGGKAEWAGGKPKKEAPNFVRQAKLKDMAKKLEEARGVKPEKSAKGAKPEKKEKSKPAPAPASQK